jgi:long-chain acyl-CoA synthetase
MHATVADLFLAGAERAPGDVALSRPGDASVRIEYAALGEQVRALARGLAALGIDRGERVALLAETRPEWTLADGGIVCAGAVVVPIYHTSSPDECRHVLTDSGARAVLCEDAAQAAKILRVRAACPALEHVVVLLGEAPDGTLGLAELLAAGAEAEEAELFSRRAGVKPEDPATIVYTSGTTGLPKGCVITHASWLATVDMYVRALQLGEERFVVFMFLPLAHVLARVTQLVTLEVGGELAFWRGDSAKLVEDIALAAPTHLPVVPRVLEKVRARALDAAETSPARKRAFDAALSLGRRRAAARRRGGGVRTRPALLLAHALADRLVLRRVRALFGPRLERLLVGAAPIAPDVLAFFDACGIAVHEGYGLTETCAAATLNAPGAVRLGTVGRPLPGVEVRIASGEVLVRGPNVFAGYWGDAPATHEALDDDGWLRTGDLGELDDGGWLRITGRTKDLIITSSGKNVTPSNVEAALREIRWVSQAIAYGDRRPYLVAALTLDPDELPALAERFDLPPDAGRLAADARVRQLLDAEVGAANARFARIEQVKRFAILDRDLSQEAGELTPTMKPKRAKIYERYGDLFERLYEAS